MGLILIITGIVLIISGIFIHYFKSIPFLGKLPGDIHIKKENFSFYFPLTSSIIISIILTLLIYLINKFR